MGIEPLVVSLVAVSVLLNIVELGAANFSEPWVFHANSGQFWNVQSRWQILFVGKTVRTVIERIFQPKTLCSFVHFFQKKHYVWVISKLRMFHHKRWLFDLCSREVIFVGNVFFVTIFIFVVFIFIFLYFVFFVRFRFGTFTLSIISWWGLTSSGVLCMISAWSLFILTFFSSSFVFKLV